MDVIKFFTEHIIVLLIVNGIGFSFTIWLLKRYVDSIFKKMDDISLDVKEALRNHNICKLELPERYVGRDEFKEFKRELKDFREEICGFIKNLEKDRTYKWSGFFYNHRHDNQGCVYFPHEHINGVVNQ